MREQMEQTGYFSSSRPDDRVELFASTAKIGLKANGGLNILTWLERELSQLAALRQATRLDRFSARANIRAAVWDKPRSHCTVGVSRFLPDQEITRPLLQLEVLLRTAKNVGVGAGRPVDLDISARDGRRPVKRVGRIVPA
jgi:hypothetical protein